MGEYTNRSFMKKILFPAYLDNFSPRKDKSFALKFVTQELSNEQLLQVNSMRDKFGYLLFKEEVEVTPEEIKSVDSLKTEFASKGKSNSQRLREVFYRLWQQDSKGYATAEEHYNHMMNTVIEFYKGKLQ